MKSHLASAFLLLAATAAFLRAEPTPLTAPLVEEKETPIECVLKDAPKKSDVPVFEDNEDPKKTPGTYHYKLWLPKGYNADATRRWPCIFVMSPGGNAGFATMKERLKDHYVCVFLTEAKNGDWPPIIGDFLAAHDDVVQRVRIQEGLKFATGQSGGARASSVFVQLRPGFSGLILQSAGASYLKSNGGAYNVTGMKRNPGLWVALTMGESDGNKKEIDPFSREFGTARLKVFMFPGGHEWAKPPTFGEVMDWIEHKIYFEGAPIPAMQPAYLQYFNDHLAGFQAAATPWQKYKTGSDLILFARNRNLAMNPQVSASLREIQAAVLQAQRDPTVSKEALAADALAALEAKKDHMSVANFQNACLDLMKLYPGTEAAARAQVVSNVNMDAVATPAPK